MTIGLVEWKEWKKISNEVRLMNRFKSEYTNIKKGLDETYDGYKNKNDKLIGETTKIEENHEKLREKCHNYDQYEDEVSTMGWHKT